MRDRLNLLIAIVLLSTVTAISYWYARALRLPPSIAVARPGSPDFMANKVVMTQFDAAGRAKHKLFAEKLVHFGDNDEAELSSPRLVGLRPDRPQVEVRAERGRVENAGERVHLHGDVVITRAPTAVTPPMRFETTYLMALPDEDKYSTDQPVTMVRGDARISAQQGMLFDNIARQTQFTGSVQMTLPPSGAKTP